MDSPHATGQLRKAPTQAFRAVFAGIGRIILAADRARTDIARTPGQHERPRAARLPVAHPRLPDRTGNVRLLTAEEVADSSPVPAPLSIPALAARPLPAGQPTASGVSTDPPAPGLLSGNVPVGASLVVHELPLAGYDSLSLASIRARLRSLDVSQLQALLMYERKHAARADVLAMVERRIQKIESGG